MSDAHFFSTKIVFTKEAFVLLNIYGWGEIYITCIPFLETNNNNYYNNIANNNNEVDNTNNNNWYF